nr:hypothetical protein CFP56_73991 [Quercus suber]
MVLCVVLLAWWTTRPSTLIVLRHEGETSRQSLRTSYGRRTPTARTWTMERRLDRQQPASRRLVHSHVCDMDRELVTMVEHHESCVLAIVSNPNLFAGRPQKPPLALLGLTSLSGLSAAPFLQVKVHPAESSAGSQLSLTVSNFRCTSATTAPGPPWTSVTSNNKSSANPHRCPIVTLGHRWDHEIRVRFGASARCHHPSSPAATKPTIARSPPAPMLRRDPIILRGGGRPSSSRESVRVILGPAHPRAGTADWSASDGPQAPPPTESGRSDRLRQSTTVHDSMAKYRSTTMEFSSHSRRSGSSIRGSSASSAERTACHVDDRHSITHVPSRSKLGNGSTQSTASSIRCGSTVEQRTREIIHIDKSPDRHFVLTID